MSIDQTSPHKKYVKKNKAFISAFLDLLLNLKTPASINKDLTIFRNKITGRSPNTFDFFFHPHIIRIQINF